MLTAGFTVYPGDFNKLSEGESEDERRSLVDESNAVEVGA